MSEKVGLAVKKPESKAKDPALAKTKAGFSPSADIHSPVGQILHLQQTIGNRAVSRLMHSRVLQAKFKNYPPNIQLSRLRDYKDINPEHDPSHLTDTDIEATNEYKAYMDPELVWQWQDHVTSEEALLACRLMLRHMREGNSVNWENEARIFMNRARSQLGTMREVESFENKLEWVPFSSSTAVSDPSLLQSEFAKWILAGGAEPDPSTGKLNCWEVILFGAYKSGYTTKTRLEHIYKKAVDNVRKGVYSSVGDTVELELKASSEYTFNPTVPNSPAPLAGDMVVFNRAAVHAAISTGVVLPIPYIRAGEHEILSLWTHNFKHVEKTTIEELLRKGVETPVKFWSVKWT